jgi:hypothetical protein
MNYIRNRLYFYPIPEKYPVPEPKPKGIGGGIACAVVGLHFLLLGILGKVFLVIGGVLLLASVGFIVNIIKTNRKKKEECGEFNRNRTIVEGTEVDEACKNYLESNLKSMALKKLGIDESEIKEVAPIYIPGYDYEKDFSVGKEKFISRKDPADGKLRSSIYSAVMFFFSAEQIFYYKVRFSLLEDGVKHEITKEFHYNDIVSVDTDLESVTYNVETADGSSEEKFSIEKFSLTTSGTTKMEATIFNLSDVEGSIQGMRNLLRRKKQRQ